MAMLKDRQCANAKCEPGKKQCYLPDVNGLYLRVLASGNKSWFYRYKIDGKQTWMPLGGYPALSLAEARDASATQRKILKAGTDPIAKREEDAAAKRTEADRAKVEEAKRATFRGAAKAYIASNRAGWKNLKHAQQWENTLTTYAFPVIGDLPCEAVDVALVKKILVPIWTTKTETASRVRSRIELVLRAWAAEQGVRDYYNPAALERLSLPKRGKVKKVEHHAALPFGEIGSFMSKLRQMKGTAARALEFAILTAARTGEVIGARWDEIDLKSNIWSIPAGRMKAEKAHQIPLSHRTREIVMMMQKARIDDAEYVFIGDHPGRPLSNMAMLALLKRMGRDDLTVHGFRSTFRDWAGEKTNYAREVVEHAMAHQLPDAAEAAYARGTLFDKRKKLMQSWASYCDTQVFAVGDKEVHVHLLRIGTAA